jgi:uncharacterized protein
MISKKGPALAGLFFGLSFGLSITYADAAAKLSAQEQDSFRTFIEAFMPAVLRQEKKHGNYRWHSSNRDCAGLVRYVFWEALQSHDDRFLDYYPAMRGSDLNRRSFRTRDVAMQWQQTNQTATQLIVHSRQLTRSPNENELKTGDLFYFFSPELRIRHVMMVIRARHRVFLVYHTGDQRDELRIRNLADLAALPETQWHADAQNPVFQGVFRPQFLD